MPHKPVRLTALMSWSYATILNFLTFFQQDRISAYLSTFWNPAGCLQILSENSGNNFVSRRRRRMKEDAVVL